jgi:hypothetical protein
VTREFAMQPISRVTICGMCQFWRLEITKVMQKKIAHDSCVPLLHAAMPIDPLVSTPVIGIPSFISKIFCPTANPKICPAVVQSFAGYMVDIILIAMLQSHD